MPRRSFAYLDDDVDRKKRIDDAIDYFGAGQRTPNRTTRETKVQ